MLVDLATTTLAPGRVLEVAGGRALLLLEQKKVWAILATPFAYQPAVGDLLLAIGQDKDFYVIGVIEGHGKSSFIAPGLLEFRSPSGIRLSGGRVEIVARDLEVKAESRTEDLGDSLVRVREVAELHAGEIRQQADGTCRVKAERIVEIAEKEVSIDGEEILLG